MHSPQDSDWIDDRIKEKAQLRKKKRDEARNPNLIVIDAGKFANQLSALAEAMTYKVEREGPKTITGSPVPLDTGVILRQLTETYNLIRFVNADDIRFGNIGYRRPYSFVILPLVRTMIDGFYNCTALLDDPSRSRSFRISGYYRIRESLEADEARYAYDLRWREYLTEVRRMFENGLRLEAFTIADLDNRANKWPLLGEYLQRQPDTLHKQLLRKLTLGFWKEYSSISHASYDGLVNIFPFIATDLAPHERRPSVDDAAERYIAMHVGRAAGLLLCLLTELQHFFKFDGANMDERLDQLWDAMIPIVEVRELYDYRYKDLLRRVSD
jgi:hypothetical protein